MSSSSTRVSLTTGEAIGFALGVLIGTIPYHKATWYRIAFWIQRPILHKRILFWPAPSTTKNDDSALLIVAPGAFKSPEAYTGLCRRIQHCCPNLHVGIGRFLWSLYIHPEQFQVMAHAILKRASLEQCSFSKVFVTGHSMGASQSAPVARNYDGLIRLGSIYGMEDCSLQDYLKPVLTIVGNRDGMIPYLSVAPLLEQQSKDGDSVVVLENVNHMHMGDGCMSKQALELGLRDIPTEKRLEQAWDEVALVVADFIASVCGNDATSRLAHHVQQTKTLVDPFRKLCESQRVTLFAKRVQHEITNGTVPLEAVTVENCEGMDEFVQSRPSLAPDGSGARIQVHAQPPSLLHTATRRLRVMQSSPMLAIQCISDKKQGESLACDISKVNQTTFDQVLHQVVTPQQRQTYLEKGTCLLFVSDIVYSNANVWQESALDVKVHVETHNATVASPIFQRDENDAICAKVLSPAQAYEWIVYDAFKVFC